MLCKCVAASSWTSRVQLRLVWPEGLCSSKKGMELSRLHLSQNIHFVHKILDGSLQIFNVVSQPSDLVDDYVSSAAGTSHWLANALHFDSCAHHQTPYLGKQDISFVSVFLFHLQTSAGDQGETHRTATPLLWSPSSTLTSILATPPSLNFFLAHWLLLR